MPRQLAETCFDAALAAREADDTEKAVANARLQAADVLPSMALAIASEKAIAGAAKLRQLNAEAVKWYERGL